MSVKPATRGLVAAVATLAAATAVTAASPGGATASAVPNHSSTPAGHHRAAYPAVQPALPKSTQLLSSPDTAPGPGYTQTSRRFTPAGIQGSYNLPALYADGNTGAGKTIAIVDSFGYPTAGADLKTFSDAYGLPMMCGMPDVTCKQGMPKLSSLTFGNHQVKAAPGASQSPGQENSNAWSVEVALDLQYAHTTAPGANILLVTTPTAETLGVQGFPAMMKAEQYVVDHHLADVVSQSFGAAEDSFGSSASIQNLRHAFQTGTAQGMTFLASSGDYGSTGKKKTPVGQGGTQLDNPQVGWPSSDPLVTAVGGTNLCTDVATGTTVDSTDNPAECQQNVGQREVGWNGSGGGFSHVFARPGYQGQVAAGSTASEKAARAVPDISMDASCRTYVVVLDTAPGYGGYYGVCGTSAASPMFAGVVAIADQVAGHDLGQINDALYKLANGSTYAADMYDVKSGDNTQAGSGVPGYAAGPGWDAVTGLGTPADAPTFVHALAGK